MTSRNECLLLPSPEHSKDFAQQQTGNASTENQQPPLFELLDVQRGAITLDNVYRNGLHALKRLEIRNLTDRRILVKMRSDLRNQIAFQLRNENLADLPSETLTGLTTNTVQWFESDVSRQIHVNQLFNYVNYIDQLELDPRQTQAFIVAFLPEQGRPDVRALQDASDSDMIHDDGFILNDNTEGTETHEMATVTGNLFFFGYYVGDEAVAIDKEDPLLTSALAAYKTSIKFSASICQSVLWTDLIETGVNFDDCMLGETYHKDFTIQNRSEIDLCWLLNTVDLSNLNREDWLQFTDAETGEPLDYRPIPGYSSRRVRLTFMPKEVGEFNYDLQVENANDARNVMQARVHASVRSVMREESLVISSGNVLDFGDCISGSWTSRQIVLSNVSESSVEVRFIPESAEVVFDIKSPLEPNEAKGKTRFKDNSGDGVLRLASSRQTSEKGSASSATTPTPTVASTSEISGPSSEVSSRASSPAAGQQAPWALEFNGVTAPSTPTESYEHYSGMKIQTPAIQRMLEENDSSSESSVAGAKSVDFADNAICNGRSAANLNSARSYTRIEDLVLRPGKQRVIQVSYRPKKDASLSDFNAGQLIRRNFRIVLEYGPYRSSEPKERKVIQCKARTCTSFVEVIPKVINFGDTDAGTLKSLPINIFNRSDIAARVELQFTSKVLYCLRGEIEIQPRSYVELKLDLYPRKVNPEYRKQITLVNYLNRDNDQIIEVQSTNIDKNRVTFHSLFYRILTATGANFLDFGSIVLNSPSLRTFTIENIRDAPLSLEITSSLPEDIAIYVKNRRPEQSQNKEEGRTTTTITDDKTSANESTKKTWAAGSPALHATNRKKTTAAGVRRSRPLADHRSTAYLDLATSPSLHALQSKRKHAILKLSHKAALMQSSQINRSRKLQKGGRSSDKVENTKKKIDTTTSPVAAETASKKDDCSDADGTKNKRSLGLTAARYKSRKNLSWSDIAGKSRVPFEDLIAVLEHGSKASTPLFPKQSAEEEFVRQQLAWRRELERLIEKKDLVRATIINLDPRAEEEVVIVFTPNGDTKPHIQTTPKNQDARIFLRLVDFDRNIEQTEFENLLHRDKSEIPVREVIVRAQLCRSVMDLGQKNINFGLVQRNERHAKSIVLHNRSETPLLYAIRKSGSIASGDITLGAGRYGVIRAFGKREIDFVFEPTLAGQFMERLVVENIRDRTNDRVLLLKAMVRKPSTFFIKSLELAFGPCLIDQVCPKVETIVITNTNKQARLFEIRVDLNEAAFGPYSGEFDFVVEDDDSNTLSKEAEEEIENLEQKLKIARRKAQPDKIKKYLKKLAKLKKIELTDEDGLLADAEDDQATEKQEQPLKSSTETEETSPKESSVIYKKTSDSVVFPLESHATKTISVRFKPVRRDGDQEAVGAFSIRRYLLAQEYKNSDSSKHIWYTATFYQDELAYQEALRAEIEEKPNDE